jgi:hypothetical protein
MEGTEGEMEAEEGNAGDQAAPGATAVGLSGRVVEQWLSRVEGDPGRLLRNQFLLEEQREWERTGGRFTENRPW